MTESSMVYYPGGIYPRKIIIQEILDFCLHLSYHFLYPPYFKEKEKKGILCRLLTATQSEAVFQI